MAERRVAVVSGGSKGIGRAIASALVNDGCDAMLLARSEKRLQQAASEITNGQARVLHHAADLRDLQGCESAIAATLDGFGRLDILVNCAGATKSGLFVDQPDEEWTDGFALKFYAAVRLSRLAWPHLSKASGKVLNIVGGFARTPEADFLVGGSVNAAMANFSKGLSKLGMRDGVNVNAIYPGLTETDRVKEIFEDRAKREGITYDEARELAVKEQGLHRLGRPEEVASLACYLCSSQADHVQGATVAMDGGATPGLY